MAINTVIFDFDGTVLDTNEVVINSWQHTYRTIEGREHPVSEISKTFGEPLAISMERAFPDYDADQVIEIYRAYQMENFSQMIRLCPGMGDLIIALKERGYKVGIVTSRLRRSTYQGLEAFHLLPYVDDVVTCEDTEKHKPDPEPAATALAHLNALPEEAIMVGDSMFDIKCAHNAGMKAVLVDWSISVTEEEKTGLDGPEYIIKEGADLFHVL